MELSELVKEVEAKFPEYRWLLRDGGKYNDPTQGNYMAHIFDERERDYRTHDFIRTYAFYADTPEEALHGALIMALDAETPAYARASGLNNPTPQVHI